MSSSISITNYKCFPFLSALNNAESDFFKYINVHVFVDHVNMNSIRDIKVKKLTYFTNVFGPLICHCFNHVYYDGIWQNTFVVHVYLTQMFFSDAIKSQGQN